MDWSEAKVKLMKFGFSAEEIGILRVKFTENPEALSIFDDEDEIVESAMKEMLGKNTSKNTKVKSCSECQRMKRKCDGKVPCTRCIEKNKAEQCTYRNRKKKVIAKQKKSNPSSNSNPNSNPNSSSNSQAVVAPNFRADEGINAITDAKGFIVFTTNSFAALFEAPINSLIGKNCNQFLHPGEHKLHNDLRSVCYISDEAFTFQALLLRPNGSVFRSTQKITLFKDANGTTVQKLFTFANNNRVEFGIPLYTEPSQITEIEEDEEYEIKQENSRKRPRDDFSTNAGMIEFPQQQQPQPQHQHQYQQHQIAIERIDEENIGIQPITNFNPTFEIMRFNYGFDQHDSQNQPIYSSDDSNYLPSDYSTSSPENFSNLTSLEDVGLPIVPFQQNELYFYNPLVAAEEETKDFLSINNLH